MHDLIILLKPWFSVLSYVGVALGTMLAGLVPLLATLRHERQLARRAEEFAREQEREREQKGIASEILDRIERFCTGVRISRPEENDCTKDPMEHLREEVQKLAVLLRDPVLRQRLDELDTAMWWARSPEPGWGTSNPYGIRAAAREVLGAFLRAEAIPDMPQSFEAVFKAAKSYDDFLNEKFAAEDAYYKAEAEKTAAAPTVTVPVPA